MPAAVAACLSRPLLTLAFVCYDLLLPQMVRLHPRLSVHASCCFLCLRPRYVCVLRQAVVFHRGLGVNVYTSAAVLVDAVLKSTAW